MWIKIALQDIRPLLLVALRVSFGLLFGVVLICIQPIQWPRGFKPWFSLFLLGLTNIAIPFFLIAWSGQTIDTTVAAMLFATAPLFTVLSAHYLLPDDKINFRKVLGLFLGFSGVIVLLSRDFVSISSNSLLGQAAVILASAFYAGSSVYARQTTRDVPGILRSAGPMFSATIVMWLATFLFEKPLEMPRLGITWLALAWLGFLASGLAFLMAYYLIHEIGPARTTMGVYLFPLRSVILSITFLHEQISWELLAGTVLIIASLAIVSWRPQIGTVSQMLDKTEN